jgi:hypothetical protein
VTATAVAGARRWTATPAPGPRHRGIHFRRTCIGDRFAEGVDTPTVQRLAGRAKPATTIADDRRDTAAGRRAIARLGRRRHASGGGPGDGDPPEGGA